MGLVNPGQVATSLSNVALQICVSIKKPDKEFPFIDSKVFVSLTVQTPLEKFE